MNDPGERPTAKYVLDAFIPLLKGAAKVAIMVPAETPSSTPNMSGMLVPGFFLFWTVSKLLYRNAGKINL